MKLSSFKKHLTNLPSIRFQLPNGQLVENHFHITEVGKVTKNFIDCGGTIRKQEAISCQLWSANDYQHRLDPKKLIDIIELSEKQLHLDDLEIEIEYQDTTIGKYGLDFEGNLFILRAKHTDCLSKDSCGIPKQEKPMTSVGCNPGSGCC